MAEPLSANDYGWFTPADLEVLFRVIHQLESTQSIILIGGQALTTWVRYYEIDLPPNIDMPYLTQDADFLGPGKIAALVAQNLPYGVARKPEVGDSTPNTATVVFVGATGEKILIDFLQNVLGIADKVVNDLAIKISINNWAPIKVLHPILVLQSRCINLQKLESKRDANGITQAKVACEVVKKYLAGCLNDPSRRREALNAAKRIVQIARSQSGVFVWTEWGIDVMAIVDPAQMPGEFSRSWTHEIAGVSRKRQIATRLKRKRPQRTNPKNLIAHLREY